MMGKDYDMRLVGDIERMKQKIFLLSLLVSVVIAIALPFAVDHVNYYESVSAIIIPFIVLGLLRMIRSQFYILFVISAIASVALFIVNWKIGYVVATFLFGIYGVNSVSDLIQRRRFIQVVESVEHCNLVEKHDLMDHLVLFLFGIPDGMDARDIRINSSIKRNSLPWKHMLRALIPGMMLMMFLWMAISASVGFHSSPWNNMPLALSIVMYILAVTEPWASMDSLDVRVESCGLRFRLFDNCTSTMIRMMLPAAIGLLIILIAASTGLNSVEMIIATAAFFVVVGFVSLYLYTLDGESDFVKDVTACWADTHPVDFYSGYDGRDNRHPLDDGVPGTPMRPVDSCFPVQKN